MLHDHQIAIFQHLSFEKRNQLSSLLPHLFNKLNERLCYHFNSVIVSEKELTIDGKSQRFENSELLQQNVQFLLDRKGTTIKDLKVINHPVGFEGIDALKVIETFTWHLKIVSPKYDYTTWFQCLRSNSHSLKKVEVWMEGEDNSVLQEPLIQNAADVTLQLRSPLPVQAILNFKSPYLRVLNILNRPLSSEEVSVIDKKLFGSPGFQLRVTSSENVTFNWKVLDDGRVVQF